MSTAGFAAAGERVEMSVSLVLVESCTVAVHSRSSTDAVDVDCTSREPHRTEYRTTRPEHLLARPESGILDETDAGPARLIVEF